MVGQELVARPGDRKRISDVGHRGNVGVNDLELGADQAGEGERARHDPIALGRQGTAHDNVAERLGHRFLLGSRQETARRKGVEPHPV